MCFHHDYDEGGFHRSTVRTARKQWPCEECPVRIEPGQRYEFASGVYEGDFYKIATCLSCVSLRDAVIEHEELEGCSGGEAVPPSGELWDSAREIGIVCEPRDRHLYDDAEDC